MGARSLALGLCDPSLGVGLGALEQVARTAGQAVYSECWQHSNQALRTHARLLEMKD